MPVNSSNLIKAISYLGKKYGSISILEYSLKHKIFRVGYFDKHSAGNTWHFVGRSAI